MNKEVRFAKTLEEVKELAKSQGNCIKEEQVIEAFAPLDLSGEQMQLVYDYLLKSKIGIGMPLDLDEFLSEEEKDYLDYYLEELNSLEPYTDGQKEAITMQAMAGDESSKGKLIEMYLKDVVDIAKLYAGQGVFLEDLIGEGNVALTMGVEMAGSQETPKEVDGMLGKLIMDAMENYIAENAANKKKDEKVAKKINDVADKARALAQDLGRKVSMLELAEETGLSLKAIEEAYRMSGYKIEDIEG